MLTAGLQSGHNTALAAPVVTSSFTLHIFSAVSSGQLVPPTEQWEAVRDKDTLRYLAIICALSTRRLVTGGRFIALQMTCAGAVICVRGSGAAVVIASEAEDSRRLQRESRRDCEEADQAKRSFFLPRLVHCN